VLSDVITVVYGVGRNLGIETVQMGGNDDSFRTLAVTMFDTKLPPGVAVANPFGEDTVLNDVSVKVGIFPPQSPKQLCIL
jgi:hypothetical protein